MEYASPRWTRFRTAGASCSRSGEAFRGIDTLLPVPDRRGMFLDRQRHRLVFARDALMRELANPDGCWWAGRGDTGLVGAGVGPRTIAQDLEAMLDRKLEIRLKRVVRALEKIEEGTYGLCDITANPIARSRLEQVPEELESSEGKMLLRARDAMPDEAESSGA